MKANKAKKKPGKGGNEGGDLEIETKGGHGTTPEPKKKK
jgi:hypothetical protein